MPVRIKFLIEDHLFEGQFDDSPTSVLLAEALPLEGQASRWGDEFYFRVPVTAPASHNATDILQPGDVGYWPVGQALCLFWGPTPASQGDECRAASPVNPVGRIEGDLSLLSKMGQQARVRVEKA
ncbi:MAG: hypothetical protein JRJ59_06725 [Deltaproteobacteria bacterium]|nr:hypothetical protein [Deltaproteobacteria bacterium]